MATPYRRELGPRPGAAIERDDAQVERVHRHAGQQPQCRHGEGTRAAAQRDLLTYQADRESLQRVGATQAKRLRQTAPVSNASMEMPAQAPTSGPPISAAATT